MRLPRLTYVVADNNGNSARVSLWLPAGTGFAGADAYAAAAAVDLQALSLGSVRSGYAVWSFEPPLGAVAQPGADSRRAAALIYSDGALFARLSIPGARLDLADATGPYAGERISRERLVALGLLSTVESLPAGTVTEDGQAWPGAYLVGSYDVTD